MKRLIILLAVLIPLFSSAQVRVDRSDTTLSVLYGDSLVKYRPEAWVADNISQAVKIGGQAHTETLSFGTTNEQGVNLLVGGNPHMIVTGIGNFGFNVGSAPEVPFLVGGGIWTQAGSVEGQMSPYSGSDLTIGTITNHPVNLQANNATLLSLNIDGSVTSAGDLHMSEKKIINIADGSDPRDAVNFQQLDAKLDKSGGEMTGGLSFGSQAVANAQDVSRHIALYSTDWGVNITSETMNFNAANDGSSTTKYAFYHGSAPIAYIEDGITDSLALITKGYFEVNKVAANQPHSTATDIAGLVADFNALIDKLVAAGLMAAP